MAEQHPTPNTTAKPPALPQRGIAGVLGAILAGVISGSLAWVSLVYGATTPLLIGLVLIVPVPIFFAGLGLGRGDALVAAVVAMATIALLLNVPVMLMLTGVFILPALMLCLLALRHRYDDAGTLYWYPAGRLITALVLYPLVVFACFSLFLQDEGIEKILRDTIAPALDAVFKNPETAKAMNGTVTPEMVTRSTNMLVSILPGVTSLSWITTLLVGALWTQFTLMTNHVALRPIPSMTEADLPAWLLILFAIMALLAMFFDGQVAYFARNTLLPLSLPYFCLGTSLVHLWATQRKHKMLLLFVFYFLVIGIVWPVVFVALAGVLEPWLHLRQRLTKKAKISV